MFDAGRQLVAVLFHSHQIKEKIAARVVGHRPNDGIGLIHWQAKVEREHHFLNEFAPVPIDDEHAYSVANLW